MIDLDALKAAGLNSQKNSERLLAEHKARQAQELPVEENKQRPVTDEVAGA